ncbi:hypothetical protein T02_5971 [Trichinella nativa]|uniref:Uncharacterized protein n=1 Tax=Trichinella nativa TaxID=6335 RepID=A0A0V1L6F7_9BILA|nr:hypothetical protein T02_4034 [Trichinella nativa]KRZ55140.1 hypothetical protein T02_5971 [Trichinella nativa]
MKDKLNVVHNFLHNRTELLFSILKFSWSEQIIAYERAIKQSAVSEVHLQSEDITCDYKASLCLELEACW